MGKVWILLFGLLLCGRCHSVTTGPKLEARGGINGTIFLKNSSLQLVCLFTLTPGVNTDVDFQVQDTIQDQPVKMLTFRYGQDEDGSAIVENPRLAYRYSKGDRYPIAIISPLHLSDEKIYSCVVAQDGQKSQSNSLSITVNVRPGKPVFRPKRLTGGKGNGMIISCTANLGKPPGTLSFSKRGVNDTDFQIMTVYKHRKKHPDGAVEMTAAHQISHLEINQDGTVFKCTACNMAPGAEDCVSEEATLHVTYPIQKVSIRPPGGSIQPGDIITCEADGYPKPIVKWTNVSSAQDLTVDGKIVKVPMTAVAEVVQCTCTATSMNKVLSINFKIVAEKQCTIEVVHQTATSATVAFSCRLGSQILREVSLEYRERRAGNPGPWQVWSTVVNPGLNKISKETIINLISTSTYDIRLRSPYPAGKGEVSESAQVDMKDPKPCPACYWLPMFGDGVFVGVLAGLIAGLVVQVKVAFDILKTRRKFWLFDVPASRDKAFIARVVLGLLLILGQVLSVVFFAKEFWGVFVSGVAIGFVLVNLSGCGVVTTMSLDDYVILRKQHVNDVIEQYERLKKHPPGKRNLDIPLQEVNSEETPEPTVTDKLQGNRPIKVDKATHDAFEAAKCDASRMDAALSIHSFTLRVEQFSIKDQLSNQLQLLSKYVDVFSVNEEQFRVRMKVDECVEIRKCKEKCEEDREKCINISKAVDDDMERTKWNTREDHQILSKVYEKFLKMTRREIDDIRNGNELDPTIEVSSARNFSAIVENAAAASRCVDVLYLLHLIATRFHQITNSLHPAAWPVTSKWTEETEGDFKQIAEITAKLRRLEMPNSESENGQNEQSELGSPGAISDAGSHVDIDVHMDAPPIDETEQS